MKILSEEKPTALISIRNVSVNFTSGRLINDDKKSIPAIKNISVDLKEGEAIGIAGESGCGKTTLARTLLGLIDNYFGEIYYRGVLLKKNNIALIRSKAQMVYQDPFSSLNPRMKIWEQVSEPARGILKIRKKKMLLELALEALNLAGLDDSSLNKYPHQFSGGQRQRIAIARALIIKPEILIADEPIASLDINSQQQIISLLRELKEKMHLSIMLISHDISCLAALTDRLYVLFHGELQETGTTAKVLNSPSHPYTRQLLESVPKLAI